MSYAALQLTLESYMLRKSAVQNEIDTILQRLLQKTAKSGDITEENAAIKSELYRQLQAGAIDETEYDYQSGQIMSSYEIDMAALNEWEKALEAQKEVLDTEATELTQYINSYYNAIQQNVKADHKYGGSGA